MNFVVNRAKILSKLCECGLTVESLAKLAHLSKNYVYKMLSGKTKKIVPFLIVAKILKLSLDDMLIYK